MQVMTGENQGVLQAKTEVPSVQNPCSCAACTIIENGVKKQRPGYAHWFCDTCGKGPFNSKEGQRPVYRRNVADQHGVITGIRFACSGICANSEQLNKADVAKRAAQARGDMETVKELRLEIDEIKKSLQEKPKEVFWPSTK